MFSSSACPGARARRAKLCFPARGLPRSFLDAARPERRLGGRVSPWSSPTHHGSGGFCRCCACTRNPIMIMVERVGTSKLIVRLTELLSGARVRAARPP